MKMGDIFKYSDAINYFATIKLDGKRAMQRRSILNKLVDFQNGFIEEQKKAFLDIGNKTSYSVSDGENYNKAIKWTSDAYDTDVDIVIPKGMITIDDIEKIDNKEIDGLIQLGIIEE